MNYREIALGYLKDVVAKTGRTATDLARSIGVAQTTLTRPLGDPKHTSALKFENILSLAMETGIPLPEEILFSGGLAGDKAPRIVPVISWVSAGAPSDVEREVTASVLATGLASGDHFATRVEGDSMDRWSPDGSQLIVNASNKDLVRGKPYIFSVKGATTYKIYESDPPRLEPFSTNPSNKAVFLKPGIEWGVVGRVVRTTYDL